VFPIYGIAGTEAPDKTGEMLSVNGSDISDMKILNDEHSHGMWSTLGSISLAKKILQETDCDDKYQYKCWKRVQKPFIYIYGNLADNGHPNAAAAQSLIKFAAQNPDFKIGLSVEGATLKRDGQKLLNTKIIGASLTVKPCNSECVIFPVNDLMKSDGTIKLPDVYKNVENRRSFREMPSEEMRMRAKAELLTKSINLFKEDKLFDDAAMMKCWNCGEAKLFMKARLPNRCTACNEAFSMQDIYQALK
jgi:hypothetical protein